MLEIFFINGECIKIAKKNLEEWKVKDGVLYVNYKGSEYRYYPLYNIRMYRFVGENHNGEE